MDIPKKTGFLFLQKLIKLGNHLYSKGSIHSAPLTVKDNLSNSLNICRTLYTLRSQFEEEGKREHSEMITKNTVWENWHPYCDRT
jgi:hypothetical protein